MFDSCLICTNFTDGLSRLVHFVPDLAKAGLKKIIFVHSIPVWEQKTVGGVDEEEIAKAREKLAPALQNVPEGLEVKIEVPCGRPKDTIPSIAQAESVDVILLGTKIRSALEDRVFGSISLELARNCSTPLMIFRPQLISTYTREELSLRCQHLWRCLLIPYNDSDAAHYFISRLKEYIAHRTSNSLQKCMLIWVVEEQSRSEFIQQNRLQVAKEKLAALKGELEQFDLEVNYQVRVGNPLQEILLYASEHDISAIAFAADTRSNILDFTVSSVASEARHRLWFPLLFFPAKS